MAKKAIADVDVSGKAVLMRCDFNVPLEGARITDDTRIRASLPTIQYLIAHDAKVILMSHLGRPRGRRVPELSLRPVAERLAELLGRPVAFAADCVGPAAAEAVERLRDGQVISDGSTYRLAVF